VDVSQWTFSTDDWAAFGRLGYKLTPNWRVEAEYGYRRATSKACARRSWPV
jgi:OOP family OmpA-OmpF porin